MVSVIIFELHTTITLEGQIDSFLDWVGTKNYKYFTLSELLDYSDNSTGADPQILKEGCGHSFPEECLNGWLIINTVIVDSYSTSYL